MKPEEAKRIVELEFGYSRDMDDEPERLDEALKVIVEALDKQIPKKVIFEKNGAKRCPSCGVKHFNPKWRPEVCNCTQKLEWGENHE